jgi:pimeloyl-ACP methyl ester carboxylesterase
MKTQYVSSPDGVCIAYDVTGSGPALMLLHGAGKTRGDWHKLGYVDRLSQDFTVITVDLRGSGDSDMLVDISAYEIYKIVADINAVADVCGISQFAVWGYSLGGNITRYLGAWSERPRAIVMHGVAFGPAVDAVFDRYIDEFVAKWGPLAEAYHAGKLNAESKKSAIKGRIPVWVACFQAMRSWPVVSPSDMHCPTLLLAGTKNTSAMHWIEANHRSLAEAGIQTEIINGLSHLQEFSQVEQVFPRAYSFLKQVCEI